MAEWRCCSLSPEDVDRVEDGGAPEGMAASGQLEQVVPNLITNAARASAESGGKVVDHGVGIPEKDFDRIFEPFYTTRRAGEDGGTISLKSEVGEGSTFRVELPVAPAEA